MEILHHSGRTAAPDVTLVLLDWSCRESFHSLRYLSNQSVPRDRYEIVWIEYYDRRSPELRTLIDQAAAEGRPSPIDQWIVMDIPKSIYYHKHLMYNVGIVAGNGRIITLCDSDAMFRPTFIQSILDEFAKDPNVVLHMDQVRNNDRKYYPFNFPSIEDVVGPGAINFSNGTTTGMQDKDDLLHSRNYGACFSALKSDLLSIGGADEHVDFVGHICGPYDLTFRLANLGRREYWHPTELLYHTWHPGQAGGGNYLGPHDGRHMSTTSLEARESGRTRPLQENPAIRSLREGTGNGSAWTSVIPADQFPFWSIDYLEKKALLDAKNRPPPPLPKTNVPILLEQGFRGFNLIACEGRCYAIPQGDGEFTMARVNSRLYRELFQGASLDEVKTQIEKKRAAAKKAPPEPAPRPATVPSKPDPAVPHAIVPPPPPPPEVPTLVQAGYRGFNLIRFENTVYAIPQGDGEFLLSRVQSQSYHELYQGASQDDVKAQIRQNHGPMLFTRLRRVAGRVRRLLTGAADPVRPAPRAADSVGSRQAAPPT